MKWFPKNEVLLNDFEQDKDVLRLKRFSQGYYTVEKYHETLVFNDLRFGQQKGWYDSSGRFAFHYYVGSGYDNILVVQRGRFAGLNRESMKSLWNRAWGK